LTFARDKANRSQYRKQIVKKPNDQFKAFEQAADEMAGQKYILRLYVAGVSPQSERAIRSVKEICEQRLKGRYDLEIVDIYQHPESLRNSDVVAVPTLIKSLPTPLRRLIGDMTNKEKLVVGLDLRPADEKE
jgi:circadian clock protein KaiB